MSLARASLACLALVLVPPALALAQPYEIPWQTVDGGGGMGASGGSYGLAGTAGQPDAGGPHAGGSYALRGGFWAILTTGGAGAQADLSVTKTDGQASAVPGEGVVYTIVVSNAGPDAANGATVSDVPPASLGGVSWTCAASPGSSCPASGGGAINHSVNLAAGGTLTYSLSGGIDPAATGSLTNTASVTPPPGVSDPNPGDNAASDTDTLTPQVDLALAKSDSPDPVGTGNPLAYTIQVTNFGPSASSGMTVTDTLPPGLTFVSSTPGPPTCNFASGTLTCSLPGLAVGAAQSVAIQVAVNAGVLGTIGNTATVSGNEPDPSPGSNSDTEATQVVAAAEAELVHGSRLLADLESVGGVPDQDLYRIHQEPYASYEVVVDAASGDVGSGQGPALERLASDATTVLQSSVGAGTGASRSLRWLNTSLGVVDDEYVRVRSQGCTTSCDAADVYRIRAWDTSCLAPRFNNSATQVTVLIVQNTTADPVSGRVAFWDGTGLLLHVQVFGVAPHGTYTLNTASLLPLQGKSGSLRLAHEGPYGALAGKAVAVEPATGFSFDTELAPRPR